MKQEYYVRDYLVVKLSDAKTYHSGEKIELSEAEYLRHCHQVETVEQYQSRKINLTEVRVKTKG